MNEEPQMAERSPAYEMIQRAAMLFEEHLENIGATAIVQAAGLLKGHMK